MILLIDVAQSIYSTFTAEWMLKEDIPLLAIEDKHSEEERHR